jgi:hypothetical protein
MQLIYLLEWNKPRAVSGTNTGSAVLNRLVGDTELSKVMSNHFRLQNTLN